MLLNGTQLKRMLPAPAKRIIHGVIERMPISLQIRVRRAPWLPHYRRIDYQRRYIDFGIASGDLVLDIGSGADPFSFASVLVDRYPLSTRHRYKPVRTDHRPFVVADVQSLPFRDKSFDFVYCAHVLEHVDDPLFACREIMRVGKRGYIETPTLCKDAMFAWADGMHKWHVVAIGAKLCFYEYSHRQLQGFRSAAFRDVIFGKWAHPLQEAFLDNQDLLNVMFSWSSEFEVLVFRLDGTAASFPKRMSQPLVSSTYAGLRQR